MSETLLLELVRGFGLPLLTLCVSLLAWIGHRQIRRLDDVERTVATKAERHELNTAIESLRQKIDSAQEATLTRIEASNRTTHERLDRLIERITQQRDSRERGNG